MENLSDRRKSKDTSQPESSHDQLDRLSHDNEQKLLDQRAVASRQSLQDTSSKDLLPPVQVVDDRTHPFLPVRLSEEEELTLHSLKLSSDMALEIKNYINKTGKDPKEAVLAIWESQNPRVIAFGEQHDNQQMREFGGEMIQELKKAGATHLALELDASKQVQDGLRHFQETGDPSGIPQDLKGFKSFVDMLQEARKSGIEIVAIDKYPPANAVDRNVDMAKNVMRYLDKDPNTRIILWLGALHLSRDEVAPNCIGHINQKYKTCSFVSINHSLNLNYLTDDLKKPVMIPLKDSPMAKLPMSTIDAEYATTNHDDFDYALFLPKSKQ